MSSLPHLLILPFPITLNRFAALLFVLRQHLVRRIIQLVSPHDGGDVIAVVGDSFIHVFLNPEKRREMTDLLL